MRFDKKIFIAAIFAIILLIVITPKTASAILGVEDTVFETNPLVWTYNILSSESGAISAAASVGQLTQKTFEWAFNIAVEVLRRQLLNMVVDQIVTWIQGGGQPKFITDWPGFLRDAADQAGGKFIQQLGLGQLCSAFGLQLRAAFIPIPTFSQRSSCTISQVGANLEAFFQDFRQGGWIAWDEMVLRPQNNIYGAYVMAWDQYEMEKSAAQKSAEAEAQAGKGFLSVRRCIEQGQEEVGRDEMDRPIYKTVCKKDIVTTPGAVVGDLAAEALGSDIPYIISAKDFAAYVAAIANAVLNRLLSEGLGLLSTAFSSGGGGGDGTAPSVTASASQCASLVGTAAYGACVSAIQSGTDIREFQKSYLISLINQELPLQNQLLGAKQATLVILNQSLTVLNSVACDSLKPSISQVQSEIKSVSGDLAKIQSDIIALQQKQLEIQAITDILLIPQLWNQVIGVVNPATTQSLVFAAQDETSRKQMALSSYQQQVDSCQQQPTQ